MVTAKQSKHWQALFDNRFTLTKSLPNVAQAKQFLATDSANEQPLRVTLWDSETLKGHEDFIRSQEKALRRRLNKASELSHSYMLDAPEWLLKDSPKGLVMALLEPFPEGDSLYKTCSRLAWTLVSEFMTQVLRAMEYCHGQGRCIGWLTAHDVRVTGRGARRAARIAFPIHETFAELFDHIGHWPDGQTVVPEWSTATVSQSDARTDLFVFGLVFYEVACRRQAFEDGQWVDPREHRSTIPKGLNRIISQCLALDPAERYSSANLLIRELSKNCKKRWPTEPKRGKLLRLFDNSAKVLRAPFAEDFKHSLKAVEEPTNQVRRRVLIIENGSESDGATLVESLISEDSSLVLRLRAQESSRAALQQWLRALQQAIEQWPSVPTPLRAPLRAGQAVMARAFPNLEWPCRPAPELAWPDEQLRLVMTFKRWTLELARIHSSLTLVIENAHFLDAVSLKVLDSLFDESAKHSLENLREGVALSLIMTSQTLDLQGRIAEEFLQREGPARVRVDLDELTPKTGLEQCAAFLGRSTRNCDALFKQLPPVSTSTRLALRQTLEELVAERALRAGDQDFNKESLPKVDWLNQELTLQALLERRWQRLDAQSQSLLQTLALAGSLPASLLAESLEMELLPLNERVQSLVRQAWVNICPLTAQLRLTHSELVDAVLRTLGPSERDQRVQALGQLCKQAAKPLEKGLLRTQLQELALLFSLQTRPAPELTDWLLEMAQELTRVFHFERARAVLSHALKGVELKGGREFQGSLEHSRLAITRLRGHVAQALSNDREAILDQSESLKSARALREPRQIVESLVALSNAHSHKGDLETAEKLSREALSLAEDIDWQLGQRQAGYQLARFLGQKNQDQAALEVLSKFDLSNRRLGLDGALALLSAQLQLSLGAFDKASDWVARASEWLDENSQALTLIDAHLLEGRIEQAKGDLLRAQRCQEKALTAAWQYESQSRIVRALADLAASKAGQGRKEDALNDYQEAWALIRRYQLTELVAEVLPALGAYYESLGQFQEAEDCFNETIEALASKDLKTVFTTYVAWAACALRRGQVGQARNLLSQAQSSSEQLDGQIFDIAAGPVQADIALQVGDLAKAEDLARQCAERAARLGDQRAELRARLILGQALASLGQLDQACQEFREASQLATRLNITTAFAQAQLGLGRCYRMLGEAGHAVSCMEAGRDAAQVSGDVFIEVQSLFELGRFHASLGQERRAQTHYDMARGQAEKAQLKLLISHIDLVQLEQRLRHSELDAAAMADLKARMRELDQAIRSSGQRGLRPQLELLRCLIEDRQGQAKEARKRARTALETARMARNVVTECEASLVLARLLRQRQTLDKAVDLAQRVHDRALKLRLAELQAASLCELAQCQFSQQDTDGSARTVREAASRYRAIWASLPEELRDEFLSRPIAQLIASTARRVLQSLENDQKLQAETIKTRPATHRLDSPTQTSEESFRDPLTDLYNHSYFMSQLDVEMKRAQRHSRPLSLLKACIDRFKLVRELFGPQVGKMVIRGVAELIQRNLRDVDIVARYFGDQFEILLPDTSQAGAMLTAERVRQAVEQHSFEADGEKIDVTLSVGIAMFPTDADERDEILRKSDEALFNARNRGPNTSYSISGRDRMGLEGNESLRDLDAMLLSREGRVIISMLNRVMNTNMKFDELIQLVTGMIIEATRGQRGFFMLVKDDGELEFRYGRNIDNEALTEPQQEISQGIAREVLKTRQAMLIEEALDDARFRSFQSVLDLRLRSILCVPIILNDQVLGVVYVDHNSISRHFTKEDLNFLKAIAGRIAVPLSNSKRLDEAERKLREAQVQLQASQSAMKTKYRYENIIGRSEPMLRVLKLLDRVVDTHHSIVIHGESGTGKELVAKAIHYNGPRKDKAYVTRNCAAVTDTILESELFGYVRGAYTGADRDSKGFFELANGGTLFLDEVGEMSERMQKKLLRVLQEGEVRRVGGKKVIPVDVRIISASNKNLRELVSEGLFREDLYYRLNVITVELPPLRERREDIPLLVDHFLRKNMPDAKSYKIDRQVLKALTEYHWPGNIRELEHEILRLLAMTDGEFAVSDLSPEISSHTQQTPVKEAQSLARYYGRPLKKVEEEFMCEIITHVLETTNWHRTKAAKILEIPTSTLHNKMRKYNIG